MLASLVQVGRAIRGFVEADTAQLAFDELYSADERHGPFDCGIIEGLSQHVYQPDVGRASAPAWVKPSDGALRTCRAWQSAKSTVQPACRAQAITCLQIASL